MAQLNLRKELLPLAVIQQGFYRQLVVFGFLFGMLAYNGYFTALWWWLLPLAVIQALLIIACGLFAALLVCWQRDCALLIQLGMIFLLFMSGVFWDLNAISDPEMRDWLLVLNPMAALIDTYRQVLLLQISPSVMNVLRVLVESLVLLAVTLFAYRKLQFWIARRVVGR